MGADCRGVQSRQQAHNSRLGGGGLSDLDKLRAEKNRVGVRQSRATAVKAGFAAGQLKGRWTFASAYGLSQKGMHIDSGNAREVIEPTCAYTEFKIRDAEILPPS